jgi:hypothetical protein
MTVINNFVIPQSGLAVTTTQLKKQEQNAVKYCNDQMDTIYDRVVNFTKNLDSSKGLAVLGPPGVGKTIQVTNALNDSKASWEDKKSATISPIGFYCLLYYNRQKHRVICLDDFDLVYHPNASHLLTMLKAATEGSYKPRKLHWDKNPTPYMIENNIPKTFEFEGNIIWITNESPATILKTKKLKTHMAPLVGPGGRLSPIVLKQPDNNDFWGKDLKYYWTKYLIEKKHALGKNCEKKKGGYSKKIQKMTLDFFRDEFNNLLDITPRFACNVADDILNFPKSWKTKAFQANSFVWGE